MKSASGRRSRESIGCVYHRGMAGAVDLTAFILAGGKSTRMGTDKAFVVLEGMTLLSRMLDLARSVATDVRIVGSVEKFSSFAPTVEDVFPGCGPLAGIHGALRSSRTDRNLILAVDLPFLSRQFLDFLITKSRASEARVTIVRTVDGWQPLCAIYRRAFADPAEAALREGRYRIDALFDDSSTCVIRDEDLRQQKLSPNLFRNLNTPEDLCMAEQA